MINQHDEYTAGESKDLAPKYAGAIAIAAILALIAIRAMLEHK